MGRLIAGGSAPFLVCMGLLTAAVCPFALADESSSLTVTTNHANALYQVGETVNFVIKVQENAAVEAPREVQWALAKEGMPAFRTGTAVIKDGIATVSATLNEPGFLRCQVKYQGTTQLLSAQAAAGVDALKIKPSLPVPKNFDNFWNQQKSKLAKVPLNARLTPVPVEDQDVQAFEMAADCVGAPVSGYFVRPKEAAPRSLPAILMLHGAGVFSASLGGPTSWAKQKMLALEINAHGIPNGMPASYYADLNKGQLKAYWLQGREDANQNYFVGMHLRAQRALDFLKSQPEWDGRTLIVFGTSQGGAQSIAAASLDKRVSFLVAGVAAMCDHTGMAVGRVAGWPKMVPNGSDGKPDACIMEASRYFDSMNFAARIRIPAFFTVGFVDNTCPPSTVYATYNNLRGPKQIFNDILCGHANTPQALQAMRSAIQAHVTQKRSQ